MNGESEQLLYLSVVFIDVIEIMNLNKPENYEEYVEQFINICHSPPEDSEIKEASKLNLFFRMRRFKNNEDFYEIIGFKYRCDVL